MAETFAVFLRFARVFGSGPDRSVVGCAEHRALAREAAAASIVLLRNDGCLPLDTAGLTSVAVLGPLAAVPNLGDGGSSDVLHTPDPVTVLDGLEAALGASAVTVVHSDRDASVAAGADLAVVVVGYTRHHEGEYMGDGGSVFTELAPPMDHPELGFTDPSQVEALDSGFGDGGAVAGSSQGGDRASLRLHPDDEQLIADTRAACDRVVVAVMAGSAVVMPWLGVVDAAMMMWYPGSEGGPRPGRRDAGPDRARRPASFRRPLRRVRPRGLRPRRRHRRLLGRVRVAGTVSHRQRPATAGGTMFINLEDETGLINVIVSKGCQARFRKPVFTARALTIRGRLERHEGAVNIIAEHLEPLALPATLPSRDFR